MLRKLYAVVSKSCCVDNPDSPQHQEVLLPGTLYGMIIKERLEEALNNFALSVRQDVNRSEASVDFFDSMQPLKLTQRMKLKSFRALHQESPVEDELRRRFEDGELPGYWQPCISLGSRLTAGFRFHHSC